MRAPLVAVCLFALVGCGGQKTEPQIPSSANEASYAIAYPAALGAAATGFRDRQVEARKVFAKFKDFPTRLHDPSWPRVLEVVEKADEVGKSRTYVDRIQRVEGAHVFFETERDEISKKVGGAVQYTVKKQNCEVDATGTVSVGLKDAVDKQLEKELRDVSDAHLLIERYKSAIKKDNVPELEKQADAIEFASYVVHVDLVNDKQRLIRMLDDADRIKGTQDDFVAAEQRWQAEKGLGESDKKESRDRILAMKNASASLDAQVAQARAAVPKMDDEIRALEQQYEDALGDLKKRIKDHPDKGR